MVYIKRVCVRVYLDVITCVLSVKTGIHRTVIVVVFDIYQHARLIQAYIIF